MASGDHLVSPSVKAFNNASKTFGHASKPLNHTSKPFNHVSRMFSHVFNHVSRVFSEGALFSHWHAYNTFAVHTCLRNVENMHQVHCGVWSVLQATGRARLPGSSLVLPFKRTKCEWVFPRWISPCQHDDVSLCSINFGKSIHCNPWFPHACLADVHTIILLIATSVPRMPCPRWLGDLQSTRMIHSCQLLIKLNNLQEKSGTHQQ